ncbi:class E sortase [Corynebacterium aquatimens]|uniref:Sortase (Surface protein transpeptidase) n=1 Tax=Corynebacterium aquatimens TaxID=1190508 RepID=A0A931GWN3_9CORY|nr:class E sortase [Corynebacterium aquatimens]MBG6122806.1 sortase (surface protein transpeptidase) [Corynebacterium aquatimens]WJY66859.1 Sortase family protein [Corynebacterium aquatimens]
MRTTPQQVLGEVFITVGVIFLLFAFYEAYWTNIKSGLLQNDAQSQLAKEWENPREKRAPALGDAFAKLYIPTFGADYQFAILEGTTEDVLVAGPGRYQTTQMPGERGNFAVAGHRVGKGAPFNDLGQLRSCDAIVVETKTEWLTYRVLPMEGGAGRTKAASCLPEDLRERVTSGDYRNVLGRHITTPWDSTVLYPKPESDQPQRSGEKGEKDRAGLEAVLTLTTCHPQFSNAERMIIHAMLVDATDKQSGPPDAMEENS